MKRRRFILATLAILPVSAMAKATTIFTFQTAKGFKVNAGDTRSGKHYKMKGITSNTLDIKISGSDTDGGLAVFEQIGQTPKGGPPLHLHTKQDEWFYILEGEYLFQVGEEKLQMMTGDTIFLPRNIQHAFVQLTEKARVIVSYLPSGKMEAFFKVTDLWTDPPSQEEIRRVMEEHDMLVTGPPLKID
jgi:quercetin dioxygenase-like cupin family protein